MPVAFQVIIIYAATKKYLLDIPVDQILTFQNELFELIKTKYPEIPASINETKELTAETENVLQAAIAECKSNFKK